MKVAKDLISQCHSETYVFVNQPGLSRSDFKQHKQSMHKLYNYVLTSSTTVKFEKIDIVQNDDIYEELIAYTMDKCNIDDKIDIGGNVTDRYQPFVEARTRVLRVDFPPLPQQGQYVEGIGTRKDVLQANDEYLRYVMGTLPTPKHTVFYMSLEKSEVPDTETSLSYDIWPEIFTNPQRTVEIDRNDRVAKEMPKLVPYRPRIDTEDDKYLTVLDQEFIDNHYGIIVLIIGVTIAFILLQLGAVKVKKPSKPQITKDVTKEKKTQ